MIRSAPRPFLILWFALLTPGAIGELHAQPTTPAPLTPAAIISIVRQTGADSAIADELARALGIPLKQGETSIAVKGRAYVVDKITRTALVPTDTRRDYIILIEENASGTVFLVTTSAGKAEKGLMNSTADPALRPIPVMVVPQLFKQQVAVWQHLLQP